MANEKVFKIKIDGISQATKDTSRLAEAFNHLSKQEKLVGDIDLTNSEKSMANLNSEAKLLIKNFDTLINQTDKFKEKISEFTNLFKDPKSFLAVLEADLEIPDKALVATKTIAETVTESGKLTEKVSESTPKVPASTKSDNSDETKTQTQTNKKKESKYNGPLSDPNKYLKDGTKLISEHDLNPDKGYKILSTITAGALKSVNSVNAFKNKDKASDKPTKSLEEATNLEEAFESLADKIDITNESAKKTVKFIAKATGGLGDVLLNTITLFETKYKDTTTNTEKATKEAANLIQKTAEDTGKKVENSTKSASDVIQKTAQDTGKKIESSAKSTSDKVLKILKDHGVKSRNILRTTGIGTAVAQSSMGIFNIWKKRAKKGKEDLEKQKKEKEKLEKLEKDHQETVANTIDAGEKKKNDIIEAANDKRKKITENKEQPQKNSIGSKASSVVSSESKSKSTDSKASSVVTSTTTENKDSKDGENKDGEKLDLGEAISQTAQHIASATEAIFSISNSVIDEKIQQTIEKLNTVKTELTQTEQDIVASTQRLETLQERAGNARGGRGVVLQQQIDAEMAKKEQLMAHEKKLQKEKEKLEKKQEKLERKKKRNAVKQNIIKAVADTASAVTQCLPNIVMAAVVGAAGAVQVGMMTAQLAKLEDGGLLKGKRHSQGGMRVEGTNIEVEGGEYVVNRESTNRNLELLRYINTQRKELQSQDINAFFSKSEQGYEPPFRRMFEEGGQLPPVNNVVNVDNESLIQAIQAIRIEPKVSVTDINAAQDKAVEVSAWSGI